MTRVLIDGRREDPVATLLVCFPHAGGNAVDYHTVEPSLDDQLRVVAYQPPGRTIRHSDLPPPDLGWILDELAEPLATLTEERDVVFLGHSFGGLIAFEAAHRLREMGRKLPRLLIASASLPPSCIEAASAQWDYPATCTSGELFDYLVATGGVPSELVEHRNAFLPMMPSLQAEYEVLRSYKLADRPALSLPIVTIAGDRDQLVSANAMEHWKDLFAEVRACHSIDAGHFYFRTHKDEFARIISTSVNGA